MTKNASTVSGLTATYFSLASTSGLKIASRDVEVLDWRKTGQYKCLEQELLFAAEASSGYSTPFVADPVDCGVNLGSVFHYLGDRIARIHKASNSIDLSNGKSIANRKAQPAFDEENWKDAAAAVPRLAARLKEIIEPALVSDTSLILGNLSLESIWFNKEEEVAIVDADQVSYGDPAYELAQLAAQLYVASVHHKSCVLLTEVRSFHIAYTRANTDMDEVAIMHRAGPLTAAFMLALVHRPDSSAYLSTTHREEITQFATWWLDRRDYTICQVRSALWTAIDMGFNDRVIDWRREFGSFPLAND